MTVKQPLVQPLFDADEDGVKVLRRVNPAGDVMTPNDAAAVIGYSAQSLRADAVKGKIHSTTVGGRMYFNRDQVEAYASQRSAEKLEASKNKAVKTRKVNVNPTANRNAMLPTEEQQKEAHDDLLAKVNYSHVNVTYLSNLLRLTPNTVRNLVKHNIIPSQKQGSQHIVARNIALLIYNLRLAGVDGLVNDSRLQTEIQVAGLDAQALLRAGRQKQGRSTLPLGTKRYFILLTQEQADELTAQGLTLTDPYAAQKKYSKTKATLESLNPVEDGDEDDWDVEDDMEDEDDDLLFDEVNE